jgi:hypothetical protein
MISHKSFVATLFLMLMAYASGVCANDVQLAANYGGVRIDKSTGFIDVNSGSVLPLTVFDVSGGNDIDITNNSNLHIDVVPPSLIKYVNGNVEIRAIAPGELVNSDDYKMGVLLILYSDEPNSKAGYLNVYMKIR